MRSSKSGKSGRGSSSTSNPSSGSKSGSKHSSKASTAARKEVEWNEWEWDPVWQREWRSREINGEWKYQYRYPHDDATPRSVTGNRETLQSGGGEQLEGTSINQSESDEYNSAAGSSLANVYNTTPGPAPSLRDNLGNFQNPQGRQEDDVPSYTSNRGLPMHSSNPQQYAMDDEDYYEDDTMATSTRGLQSLQLSSSPQQNTRSNNGGGTPWMGDNALIATQRRNQQVNLQEQDGFYRAAPGAPVAPFPYHYTQTGHQTGSQVMGYPPHISPYAEESSNSLSPSTERAPTLNTTHITQEKTLDETSIPPTASAQDSLYGKFKVHPAKEFKKFKVFRILWSEPMGQSVSSQRTDLVKTKFGEQCYSSIRRFVIFRRREAHCLCLPILTYNGQGTAKPGAKPQDHAIIYTRKRGETSANFRAPKETEDEEKLLKKPIRMEPKTNRDQLDSTSRLNYAKIYTVEYNVKVNFIGEIHKDSIKHFSRDYNIMHAPLPEGDDNDYSDENQDFQQLDEWDTAPQNQSVGRDTAPSSRQSEYPKEKGKEKEKEEDDKRGKKKNR